MSQRPTARQLIERLREIYSVGGRPLSDENLASRLPIGLSTLHRWKKEDTEAFSDTLEMLEVAGWLNIAEDANGSVGLPPDPLEAIAAGVTELLADQKELLERVRRVEQRELPKSPAEAAPKRRRKTS